MQGKTELLHRTNKDGIDLPGPEAAAEDLCDISGNEKRELYLGNIKVRRIDNADHSAERAYKDELIQWKRVDPRKLLSDEQVVQLANIIAGIGAGHSVIIHYDKTRNQYSVQRGLVLSIVHDQFVDDYIEAMVFRILGITMEQMCSKNRASVIVKARMAYVWMMRTFTEYSLGKIGRNINRDHASVLHYIRITPKKQGEIFSHMAYDNIFAAKVASLYREIRYKFIEMNTLYFPNGYKSKVINLFK